MEQRRCRFITLTLRGSSTNKLSDVTDRLYKSFRYLRSHPLWDKCVDGGCAFLEVKRSDRSNRWHPHLHIIAEGRFLPQGELSDAWRSITKDSWIVDIQDASTNRVGHYVAKYASKPLNTSFCNNPEWLDEAVETLRGRRLVMTFGTWYGTALTTAEEDELADDEVDAGGWSCIMGLEELFEIAASGDVTKMAMVRAIPGAFERFVHYTGSG